LGFGLFAGESYKLNHRPEHTTTVSHSVISTVTATAPSAPTPVPTAPPAKNSQVCLTSTCVRIAAGILEGLDETVDPCDDFYSFANGGWLEQHVRDACYALVP
jgi:endothelin-converting enzyme